MDVVNEKIDWEELHRLLDGPVSRPKLTPHHQPDGTTTLCDEHGVVRVTMPTEDFNALMEWHETKK